MKADQLGTSYLALPDGTGPFPGVVVVHEAFGLNDNIRDICARFAGEGYAALGVDLFAGRSRAACMARMFAGMMAGNLEHYGVPALKAALGQLAGRSEVDAGRIGAIGFCLGGSIVLTWACTDNRLTAIAPFYGMTPRPREATRRLCPVVGSWPGRDLTTRAAGVLETRLTAAGVPHDLKVYPGARHSFFNDQWRTYDSAAAADSWRRVLAFFAEHVRDLRPCPPPAFRPCPRGARLPDADPHGLRGTPDARLLGDHSRLPAGLPALPGLGDDPGSAWRADDGGRTPADRPGSRVRAAIPDPDPDRR
jgi:carboxymethylenebutenolidase